MSYRDDLEAAQRRARAAELEAWRLRSFGLLGLRAPVEDDEDAARRGEQRTRLSCLRRLAEFLLEPDDFTFVGSQRRVTAGEPPEFVDLVFFNRRVRCLILVELKLGEQDAEALLALRRHLQHARTSWTLPGERPPIGLLLCVHAGRVTAQYVTERSGAAVLHEDAALPDEATLVAELEPLFAEEPARRG